jgi:PAS domain S-box-containing protein
MTAQHLAETQLVDGLSAQRLLEGLARIYRWLLVTDSDRRVLWMSEGFSTLFGVGELEVGVDARSVIPKLPRPEQVFSLRSAFRNKSHVSALPIEVRKRDGSVICTEVSVLRIDTTESGRSLLLAVARPCEPARVATGGDRVARALVDGAPNGMLAVDADGFVTHSNPAARRLTGRTAEQLTGFPAALLFGDSASDLDRIASSFERGDSREYRVSLQLPDSDSTPVLVSVSTFGTGCRALFLRDASPSEVECELRRANDELEHCVNSLAHDLRSPLVALLGFSRLLRQEYGSLLDATGEHFLDRIDQAGRTMESLVHDLLELSRIGQGGDRPSLVDPRGVLVQLRAELKPRLDVADVALLLPEEPPPLVYCDRTRLYQLLSNLIGNAIEHMGDADDARIEVSVSEVGDGHRITVRDNGRGIPPEHASRIFEPFQSFPRAEGRRGTGMGLAIVKKIAEKQGGRVWVESAPGEGAAFHVLLPRG